MLSLSHCGQIRLSRGDTLILPISINQGDTMNPIEYLLGPHDELYFGVMEPNQPWEYAILKKKFTSQDVDEDGRLSIKLKPNDTMCLLPGLYYYQVKVRIYDYDNQEYIVNTIMSKTQFWVEE